MDATAADEAGAGPREFLSAGPDLAALDIDRPTTPSRIVDLGEAAPDTPLEC